MGLAITLGLRFESHKNGQEDTSENTQLAAINTFLASRSLSTFEENPDLDNTTRHNCTSFPYNYIHYLRRAYALSVERPKRELTPAGSKGLETAKDSVQDLTEQFASHLLCHADYAGYYVPVDFEDPLFAPQRYSINGAGLLGSSYALLRELTYLAPYLDIKLDEEGTLSDQEVQRTIQRTEPGAEGPSDPFERELVAWLALFESCRVSIEQNVVVIFR